jgi:hypothetical protein
LVVIEL